MHQPLRRMITTEDRVLPGTVLLHCALLVVRLELW